MYRAKVGSRFCMRMLSIGVIVTLGAVSIGSCFFDSETTLCASSNLRCPPGWICSADQSSCIEIGACGDGIISTEKGEVCDDGNLLNRDGCSADCRSNETCGNNVLDPGESCDDGNVLAGDSCSPYCVLAACGNGAVDVNEQCDPGMPGEDTMGCDSNCTFSACGDGYVNATAGEDCDTGDRDVNTETCNGVSCKMPKCGDKVFNAEAGEQCDTGGDSQACNGHSGGNTERHCKIPECGDGYLNASFDPSGLEMSLREECDDGNEFNNDMCPSGPAGPSDPKGNCQLAECGDDHVRTVGPSPEECDDGAIDLDNDGQINSNTPDACRTNCHRPSCGDGIMDSGEACDEGASNSDTEANACRRSCVWYFCGDGVVDTGEDCEPLGGPTCNMNYICDSDCLCKMI